MPGIPGFLLRHRVVVEPFTGQGGNGPTYGPAVTERCFREDGRRLVRNDKGEQVVSETTVYCRAAAVAPPLSRVTLLLSTGAVDRIAYVITAKNRDGGGLPTPDHLELSLT